MSGPAYVSDPSVSYLHQLLDELEKGHLQIPRFQRRFVWTDDQRVELLQSIRDGIPIGSILVWRTSQTALKTVQNIGPHTVPAPAPSPSSLRSYLLDGLQRLSTLYGCLKPLAPSRPAFHHDDDGKIVGWLIGFDLVTERFQILGEGEAPEPTWLPLPRLLDSVRLLQFQRGLSDREDADLLVRRADALAETFRGYKLPVIPVVTEDLATATRTFERVNRQGTRMSELHMVRALTWTSAFDLEDQLSAVRDRLTGVGWESFEPEWILKVCKAGLGLDIAVEDPDETSKQLAAQPGAIETAEDSLLRAARWLADHCDVLSPKIVPYQMQIVMLAEAMHVCPNPPAAVSQRLAQWFWWTTYTERFSGITGGQTNAMLDAVRRIAGGRPFELKAKERPPTFAQPTTFNQNWARVRTIALRLAALTPLDLDGSDIQANRLLASDGAAVMVPLTPQLKGSAARMFIQPNSELREALLTNINGVNRKILASHAITEDAARALATRDLAQFVELRGAEIHRLEMAFYQQSQVASLEDPTAT